jgi:hypothetical protein
VGRAPAFWTELNSKLIQDNFVPVSVSNYDQGRKDAVGQFFKDAKMQLPGAGGSQWAVTASGKVLEANNHHGLGFNIKKALEKWNALPATERAPGAVKVGDIGEVDPLRTVPTPPAGGLILKVYYRAFMRDGNKLRYVTGKDLWHDEIGKKTEEAFDTQYPGRITTAQAQPDHMWLTEAEWRSLLPNDPKKGDKAAVPAGITDRFFRWHLNPLSVYGETTSLGPKAVRAGALSLTVDAVSATSVKLRLDGFARLGTEAPKDVAAGTCASIKQWGYEPRVLGFIDYDRASKSITRFDAVAIGDHFGRLGIADSATRIGLQPLGISFELVTGDVPANRIPPGRTPTAKNYLQCRPGSR